MIKSISRSSFPFEFVTTGAFDDILVFKINTSVASKGSVVDNEEVMAVVLVDVVVVEVVVSVADVRVVVELDGVVAGQLYSSHGHPVGHPD